MGILDRRAGLVTAVLLLSWAVLVFAGPKPQYPIIFSRMADLEQLGLSLGWPPQTNEQINANAPPSPPVFPNGCYWYAGNLTHYLFSVSDELLALYTARGFSRESLCMGLVSTTLYDPETGARLPTFIFRNDAALATHHNAIDPDRLSASGIARFVPAIFPTQTAMKVAIEAVRAGQGSDLADEQIEVLFPDWWYFSEERPLALPDCYRNGTPLLDCTWRHSKTTGAPLPDDETKGFRTIGETIHHQIKSYISGGGGKAPYQDGDASRAAGYLRIDRHIYHDWEKGSAPWSHAIYILLSDQLRDTFNEQGRATCFAVSPALPNGFGYILDAAVEGFGDGTASAADIKFAFDRSRTATHSKLVKLKSIVHKRTQQ